MKDNFESSLVLVLKSEGGFTTDTHDNGNKLPDGRAGSTNLGVTQANWEAFVGHPVTWDNMKALTAETVAPFYKRKYWDVAHCDELPQGLDYLVFDFAVNAGVGRSIKTLQTAIGVTADGSLGPLSLSAINNLDPKLLIERFTDAKEKFYKALNNPTYEKGWLARTETVEKSALSMIA
jgi:lysozyme family protein